MPVRNTQPHKARSPRAAALTALLILNAGVTASFPTQAQMTRPVANMKSLPGNSWDSIKQLPDFYTGIWEPRRDPRANATAGGGEYSADLAFTPAYKKKFESLLAVANSGGDVPTNSKRCIFGFGGSMGGPESVFAFSFTPGRIVIAQSTGASRFIYLDGRPLPDDPDESFQGFSIGHWEGKTLVVETAGLDRGNEIVYGLAGGKGMRVHERITLTSPDILTIESTLEAPQALTKPLKRTNVFNRHADWPMIPYDCAQNNRSVDPSTGHQKFDLTPPE